MRVRLLSLVALVICCLAAPGLRAQTVNVTSGSINGRVTDSTSAVLPGVAVTATNLDTGFKRSAVSEKDGAYTINLLPPGKYRVDAELSGLGKASVTNVEVLLGNATRADLKIAPQMSETVTVTADTVDTIRSATANSVTSAQIANLPILGRDFKSLAALTPGIVDAFGGRVTANGARGIATDYNIDGATSNNDFFGENTGGTRAPFTFSQAAIREFQVVRSQYDAEYGRGVGAQVNAITKSGTNDYHGEGFLFYRDRGWAAGRPKTLPNGQTVTDSFRAKDSKQAGGAIGGPILKDRAFFFGNFDSQRQRLPTTVTSTDVRLVSAFTSLAQATQDAFFAKLATIEGGPYADQLAYDQTFNQNTYLGKVDVNIGKSRLSVRDNYTNFENANNQTTRNLSNQGTEHDKFNQLVGQVTTNLSSKMVNEATAQLSVDQRPITSPLTGPEISVSGITSGAIFYGKNDGFPNNTKERKIQVKDSVHVVLGDHSLKFGGEGLFMHIDNLFARNLDGQFRYNTVAQFTADTPNSFLQGYGAGGGLTAWNQNTYAFFATDSFRPIARLTVDAGLRYDWQTMPLPATNVFPQHPNFITDIHEDHNNIAPRFGAAYDLRGDGKSVVRGGVGKFFGYMPDILLSNPLTQISGNFLQITATCATAVVPCPAFPNKYTPAEFAAFGAAQGTDIVTVSPTYQAQQAWRSSVQFEQQLFKGYSAAVGGIFSKMAKVQGSRNVNAVYSGLSLGDVPVYDLASAARLYTDMGVVRELCSCEDASYKAMTLEFHKRTASKWEPTFDVNYTLAKAIDEESNERSTSTSFLYDPFNPALSRGPSDNDVRHRFVGSATYRLPWYQIDVSGIFQARSGLPYTPGIAFTGSGTSATSVNGLSQTSGNIPVFVDSTGAIINLLDASFASITRQQFHDNLAAVGGHIIGRNAYRQPGWHNLDIRVTKSFDFKAGNGRSVTVQVLAEGFNLLNTKNQFVSSTNQDKFRALFNQGTGIYTFNSTGLTNFGLANSYASTPDPRQGQFAVKIIF